VRRRSSTRQQRHGAVHESMPKHAAPRSCDDAQPQIIAVSLPPHQRITPSQHSQAVEQALQLLSINERQRAGSLASAGSNLASPREIERSGIIAAATKPTKIRAASSPIDRAA